MGVQIKFNNIAFVDYIGGAAVVPTAPFISISKDGTVSISSNVGGTIRYTTNGSTPNSSSAVYSGPFKVSSGTYVKAITILNGQESSVAIKQYIAEEKPTVNPPSISIDSKGQVTIIAISGTIHYTTNGQNPTSSSATYSQPFTVTDGTTVKAIAVLDGVSSSVAQKTYHKEGGVVVPPPVISITEEGMVTITAEPDCSIHHTTDGSQPSHSVVTYTGPFQVASGTVVKAIASRGGEDSVVVEATYTAVPSGPSLAVINWVDGFSNGQMEGVQTSEKYKICDRAYTLEELGLTIDSVLLIGNGKPSNKYGINISMWNRKGGVIVARTKGVADFNGCVVLSEVPKDPQWGHLEPMFIRISIGNSDANNKNIDANTFAKSAEYANLRVE